MLKRWLGASIFILIFFFTAAEGHRLFLSYFILPPLLLFLIFHFYDDRNMPAFWMGSGGFFAMYLYFLFRRGSAEMLQLGAGSLALLAALIFYRRQWALQLDRETTLTEESKKELTILQDKHRSRLDSLHHLEKQVSGLLELFEIARDFSETLSNEGIAEILQKRVMPQLPCERMRLVLSERTAEGEPQLVVYRIDAESVGKENAGALLPAESEILSKARNVRQVIKNESMWFFPLSAEDRTDASLGVERAQEDDLAKFEVLAAYLGLQVKKVRLYQTVKDRSIRDGLTGVFVRRHFQERYEEELKRSLRYHLPLAVLMLDIDHFKRYNDDHGHLAGDATLKQVASLLRENLRQLDIVARYGGEEFIAVIPETKKEGAFEAAERIRSNIARHNFKIYDQDTRVTVSIGVALYPTDIQAEPAEPSVNELAFELIRCADLALYRAKEEGRNRIVFYQDL